jgi:hypothetical protein
LKIKKDKLRLPEIRKQKNFNKLRVATNSSMFSSKIKEQEQEQEQQTAPKTIKFLFQWT